MDNNEILKVVDLRTSFKTASGLVRAVDGVSFSLNANQCLGIVGESGSGKSVTANTIMKLLPKNARIESGRIYFNGVDITNYNNREMRPLRGKQIASIFQDPMTSLDPVFRIGEQMIEGILAHLDISKAEAIKMAIGALEAVGIPDPERRMNSYPHEFSGGMRQRVMIAMAVVLNPGLIIADEPTTALDVTVQVQVLNILKSLQEKMGTGVILITHNLGVVWDMCDEVIVMYAGKIVEKAKVNDLYSHPFHPYTRGLMSSIPTSLSNVNEPLQTIPGTPPDLRLTGSNCNFNNRCSYCREICLERVPELVQVSEGHFVACHFVKDFAKQSGNIGEGL